MFNEFQPTKYDANTLESTVCGVKVELQVLFCERNFVVDVGDEDIVGEPDLGGCSMLPSI